MSRLKWDESGKRKYENGISHGVLYTQYPEMRPNVRDGFLSSERSTYHPGTWEIVNPISGATFRYNSSIYSYGDHKSEFSFYPACIADTPTGWGVEYEEIDGKIVSKDPNIVRTTFEDWSTAPPSEYTAWINLSKGLTGTEIENGSNDYVIDKLTDMLNSANEAVGAEPVSLIAYRHVESIKSIEFVISRSSTFRGVLAIVSNGNWEDVWPEIGRPYSGVSWNGLTNVSESPDGAEANDLWADNLKYSSPRSKETFGMTIEAYTYPDEFSICDGTKQPFKGVKLGQQTRLPFCMSYRTEVGNDTASESDDGYLLHLVYNCTASPSDRAYETINDSPDAITFSWECNTTPQQIADYDYSPVSTITIDSNKVKDLTYGGKRTIDYLEEVLYGNSYTNATMPSPDYVIKLFLDSSNSVQQPEPEIPVEGD